MYKFSIIIPLYNHKHRIPLIVETLEKQTYQDFEVHFCDDHSKDGTKEFFKTLGQLSFPYKYHRKKWRNGMVIARNINQGIFKANGEYCLVVMGDSILHEEYLNQLIKFVTPNTVVCGVRQDIDEKYNMVVDTDYRIKNEVIPLQIALLPTYPFLKITGNGLCIPTKSLREVGGWHKIKGYGGDDNILAAKLFKKGHVFFSVPSMVLFHFNHGTTPTSQKRLDYVKRKVEKILGL